MQLFLLSALLAHCFTTLSANDAYDHVKEEFLAPGVKWLEVGFFTISPDFWTTVETTYTNFLDPVVFLSLPNLPGNTPDVGQSMSLRVKDATLNRVDANTAYYSFQAKSLNASSKWCLPNFYTPSELDLPEIAIGWMVVEKGKFNISDKGFLIHSDMINLTNKFYKEEHVNQKVSYAPATCDGGIQCALTVDNVATLLTIAQLQTTRFNTFLLLRGNRRAVDHVVYMLTPADSSSDFGYSFPDPGEEFAWMLFETGVTIACSEDLAIESFIRNTNSVLITLNYANTYTLAPALYGMVMTISGRDSVGLRAFNQGVNSANYIIQEDKCAKSETNHGGFESTAILIIGSTVSVGSTLCGATFNEVAPSRAPTPTPTVEPTPLPTVTPTNVPTAVPTHIPTLEPTANPTVAPTVEPTPTPTYVPTPQPSVEPTNHPTTGPTYEPSTAPTAVPTESPTPGPTAEPSTATPTADPTPVPTFVPTVAPTASPTAHPTPTPTYVPTAAPTATPTSNPTAEPTHVPTHQPTAEPTTGPTAFPTESPTPKPTAKPTARPTMSPTRNNTYCVEVTLYDTFGDGWGNNVALEVSGTSIATEYMYYSCPNSTDISRKYCNRPGESIFFDVVTFEPPAAETWEIYWTVRTLGQDGFDIFGNEFDFQYFVGDYDTNMTALDTDVEVFNPVDSYQNQTCQRCKHPPKPKASPKSKPLTRENDKISDTEEAAGTSNHTSGRNLDVLPNSSVSNSTTGGERAEHEKPKPKPPHWPFPISLFDTDGAGWFNSSEKWVVVPQRGCAGASVFSSSHRLPEALTNPEYVISTFDRTAVLRRNTICGDLLKEDCEERLPDGKYIFRVGGALSRDHTANNSMWRFCNTHGTVMEELQFKLVKGKCFPGAKLSSTELLAPGTHARALYVGSLVLSNVVGAGLTEYDTNLLESILAESFSIVHSELHRSVSLTSWEFVGSSLTVQFRLSINPGHLGIGINEYSVLDALAADLLSSAQMYVTSGHFVSTLKSGLLELPLDGPDVLSATAAATLVSLEYASSEQDERADLSSQPHASLIVSTGTVSHGHSSTLDSFTETLFAAALFFSALLAVGMLSTFVSSRRSAIHSFSAVNDSSESVVGLSGDSTDVLDVNADAEIPNFA